MKEVANVRERRGGVLTRQKERMRVLFFKFLKKERRKDLFIEEEEIALR